MKKLLNVLLLSMAITTAFANKKSTKSSDAICMNALENSTVMFAVTEGKFYNPNAYAKVPNYNIHALTNTLTYESYKYLQGDFMQVATLASAMEAKLVATLPTILKETSKKCKISEQDIINVEFDKIKENDPKINRAAYRFIQIYVPNYLKAYGYIQ